MQTEDGKKISLPSSIKTGDNLKMTKVQKTMMTMIEMRKMRK